ncbi:MAG: glycoside hydrolase family 25 protein [Bacteroidetes bacterium]|nr:glycoside hydrolase family 25 protein [Bacteroidota bacterium]
MKFLKKFGWLLLACMLLGIWLIDRYVFIQTPNIHYPNFGISIPAGYSTHGIDVSKYQKKINWESVVNMRDKGQRISFAIAKATEGTHRMDKYFERNWDEMKSHDLLRGAYLYFHPNRNGKEQAKHFVRHVKLEPGDLPPVIDIEERNGASATQIKQALDDCIEELRLAYGKKPIIYTNPDFYNSYLGDDFNAYPLWIAHYEQCKAPCIQRKWIMWQHNCKGRVDGIDAEVDFNVVNGSLFALSDLCL